MKDNKWLWLAAGAGGVAVVYVVWQKFFAPAPPYVSPRTPAQAITGGLVNFELPASMRNGLGPFTSAPLPTTGGTWPPGSDTVGGQTVFSGFGDPDGIFDAP